MNESVCIIGASGFVGGRALRHAQARGGAELRVLVHSRKVDPSAGTQIVEGDAADHDSLRRLLTPGAVVLNFAYGGEAAAGDLARALGRACAERGVRRLVHVSTCSVYGRTAGRFIDEASPCAPITPYERAKHQAEQILEAEADGQYELAILRPAAVFGPGGKNLESLARRVLTQSWPRRYLHACAMGRRRMHAVDVESVAAAAVFLASAPLSTAAERFIVSQDNEAANNYASIESFFIRAFRATPYPMPPLAAPVPLLRLALRIAGRTNAEPQRLYSASKLTARGFAHPRSFAAGLDEYAAWVQQTAAN